MGKTRILAAAFAALGMFMSLAAAVGVADIIVLNAACFIAPVGGANRSAKCIPPGAGCLPKNTVCEVGGVNITVHFAKDWHTDAYEYCEGPLPDVGCKVEASQTVCMHWGAYDQGGCPTLVCGGWTYLNDCSTVLGGGGHGGL